MEAIFEGVLKACLEGRDVANSGCKGLVGLPLRCEQFQGILRFVSTEIRARGHVPAASRMLNLRCGVSTGARLSSTSCIPGTKLRKALAEAAGIILFASSVQPDVDKHKVQCSHKLAYSAVTESP